MAIMLLTDSCYVEQGGYWELVKELDFDCGLFQSISGMLVIETAIEVYPIWQKNFLCYWLELQVFEISVA